MSNDLDIGLFPLDMVILPGERAPLHVFEPRYRQLVADTTLEDRPFVMIRESDGVLAEIGTLTRFATLVRRFEDGRMTLIARGERPVRVTEHQSAHLYRAGRASEIADEDDTEDPTLVAAAEEAFRRATGVSGELPAASGVARSYALAGSVDLGAEVKQRLLESRSEPERLRLLAEALDAAGAEARHQRMAAERAQTNGRVTKP